MESWRRTLEKAISLGPEHLSLYSLIVEPGTVYARLQSVGRLSLPEDDDVADMYLVACEMLRDAGFAHYEVANWSRPGFEARHNLAYWHNRQFFAAGVGAYDYLRPYRSVRVRSVRRYVERMSAGTTVIVRRDHVTREIERFETAVMASRLLTEGISRVRFQERFPEGLDRAYGPVIAELTASGFLVDEGHSVRLRETMVPLANEAWERFLPADPA